MPLLAVSAQLRPGRICIKPVSEDEYISVIIRQSGCWEAGIVNSVLHAMILFPSATFLGKILFVKLRQGLGKDRQGMAVKAKGLKA